MTITITVLIAIVISTLSAVFFSNVLMLNRKCGQTNKINRLVCRCVRCRFIFRFVFRFIFIGKRLIIFKIQLSMLLNQLIDNVFSPRTHLSTIDILPISLYRHIIDDKVDHGIRKLKNKIITLKILRVSDFVWG